MLYESFEGIWAPIIATFFWSLGIGAASFLLVFKTKLFNHLLDAPLAPPFLNVPAIMFAFLMGFMSSDAWQDFAHARTALINEASSISRLIVIPLNSANLQERLNTNMQLYLEAVLEQEWANSRSMSESAKSKKALDNLSLILWQAVAQCSNQQGPCMETVTSSSYINALDNLRNAREQRLSLGYVSSVNTKWFLAIILAFLSALSVAAAHRYNQKTGVTALVLCCCSIWVIFSVVSMYSNPYKWAERIEPVPLISILNELKNAHK